MLCTVVVVAEKRESLGAPLSNFLDPQAKDH